MGRLSFDAEIENTQMHMTPAVKAATVVLRFQASGKHQKPPEGVQT
jgi:hypothetical protein